MWAEFDINGEKFRVQCRENEVIKDVYTRCSSKFQKPPNANKVNFLYNGNVTQPSLQLSQIVNNLDRSRNQLSIIVTENIPDYIRHDNYVCPDCFTDAYLTHKNFKFNLSCKYGHKHNNLSADEFRETQKIETKKIICGDCKENNLDNCDESTFFRCNKCNIFLCEKCKVKHANNEQTKKKREKHSKKIVNFNIENFECSIHKKAFNSYCVEKNIDLCQECLRNPPFGNIKEYPELLGDINIYREMKERLLLAQKAMEEKIYKIFQKLYETKNLMDSYIKLHVEILDKSNLPNLNYSMIQNIKSINSDEVITDLNKFNNSEDNLINTFQDIIDLNYRMKYSDDITLRYKINHNDSAIKIFGEEFVKNNVDKCKMVIKNKETKLRNELYINKDFKYDEKEVIVILKYINKVINWKEAFCGTQLESGDFSKFDSSNAEILEGTFKNCRNLTSLEIYLNSKITTTSYMFAGCINMKYLSLYNCNMIKNENMSHMFQGDSSLVYIKFEMFETSNVNDMNCVFYGCKKLKSFEGISNWNTENVTTMAEMFNGCESLITMPDISEWNTSNVKDIHQIFYGCKSLRSLPDISKWDTNNITDLYGAFCGCSSLTTLPDISKWRIDKVQSLANFFHDCRMLKEIPDISCWNASNVNDISKLFYNCTFLREIPSIDNWDTSNVKNMKETFFGCKNLLFLPDISRWNTSNVETMEGLFNKCKKIPHLPDIEKWITVQVKTMKSMFRKCGSLKSLPNIQEWNTNNVTNINSMFTDCISLISFPDITKWETSNIEDMAGLFSGCGNVEIFPDLSKWDMRKVLYMNWMFNECNSLIIIPDIGKWKINKNANMFEIFKRNEIENNKNEMPKFGIDLLNMNNLSDRLRRFCRQVGFELPN